MPWRTECADLRRSRALVPNRAHMRAALAESLWQRAHRNGFTRGKQGWPTTEGLSRRAVIPVTGGHKKKVVEHGGRLRCVAAKVRRPITQVKNAKTVAVPIPLLCACWNVRGGRR